jgi:hypothetical protein
MIRLERTRQEPHGLGEIKELTSRMYVFLASEPFGRWPTGRNRLVCVCVYRLPRWGPIPQISTPGANRGEGGGEVCSDR